MTMSDSFAATAAQILPVLGLAGVIELQVIFRSFWKSLRNVKSRRDIEHVVPDMVAAALAYAIWVWLAIRIVESLLTSLRFLGGEPVQEGAAQAIYGTIKVGIIFLIALPAVAIPVMSILLAGYSAVLLTRRSPANSLDDHPIAFSGEPHVRSNSISL
jgi:hypothetical protein